MEQAVLSCDDACHCLSPVPCVVLDRKGPGSFLKLHLLVSVPALWDQWGWVPLNECFDACLSGFCFVLFSFFFLCHLIFREFELPGLLLPEATTLSYEVCSIL